NAVSDEYRRLAKQLAISFGRRNDTTTTTTTFFDASSADTSFSDILHPTCANTSCMSRASSRSEQGNLRFAKISWSRRRPVSADIAALSVRKQADPAIRRVERWCIDQGYGYSSQ